MKIILSESQIKKIVDEALRDDIPSYMSDIIQNRHANIPDILDRDVPEHTDKIPNVKVEITNEKINEKVKKDITNTFTTTIISQYELTNIAKELDGNRELTYLITKSLSDINMIFAAPNNISGWIVRTDEGVIKAAGKLYSKEFLLPTSGSTDISKPVFSKNKSGIATFLKVAKKIYPELSNLDVDSLITDKRFVGLRQPIINYHQNLSKIVDETKLYLYISDKPDDKLRMSLSKYYDSCQNLYSGNDEGTTHNRRLLSNVFDANSKVAYLIYDSPFTDNRGNQHPFTSIARMIIRVNEKGGIMFDRVYPTNMGDDFNKIVQDNTGLKNVGKTGDVYTYSGITGLPDPYMDKYEIRNVNNLEGHEKVKVLAKLLNITNLKRFGFTFGDDDSTIICEDLRWGVTDTYKVFSEEDMEEKCRDYMIDDVAEYFDGSSETTKTTETRLDIMINNNIVPYSSVEKLLGRNIINDCEELGLDLGEYLEKKYNVERISDFEDLVLSFGRINDMREWYVQNLDVEKAIKFFGGYGVVAHDLVHNRYNVDMMFNINHRTQTTPYREEGRYGSGYYVYKLEKRKY